MKIGNVTAIASLSSLPPCLSNHFTARLAAIVPAATPALLGSHYSNHFTARLAAIVPAATPALLGSHYSNHFTARLAAIVPAAAPALLGSHYSNHFTARLAAIVPAAAPALLGSHYSNHFTARLALPNREQLGHVIGHQLGQAHRVQHLADRDLDLLHRPSQVAASHLRTVTVALHTLHDVDRALERAHHLPDRDLRRSPGQRIPALRPVGADDQPPSPQPLENLAQDP